MKPLLEEPPAGYAMPAAGWHQLDGGICAHVVPDQHVYQVRYFPPGFVTADNYESIGRQSVRMASIVFGRPTPPPSPQLQAPADRKGKQRAID